MTHNMGKDLWVPKEAPRLQVAVVDMLMLNTDIENTKWGKVFRSSFPLYKLKVADFKNSEKQHWPFWYIYRLSHLLKEYGYKMRSLSHPNL